MSNIIQVKEIESFFFVMVINDSHFHMSALETLKVCIKNIVSGPQFIGDLNILKSMMDVNNSTETINNVLPKILLQFSKYDTYVLRASQS